MCANGGRKWSPGMASCELRPMLRMGVEHPPTQLGAEPKQLHASGRQPAPHLASMQGWLEAGSCCPLQQPDSWGWWPCCSPQGHRSLTPNYDNKKPKKIQINFLSFPPGTLSPELLFYRRPISHSWRSVGKSYYRLRLTISQITRQCRDQI